MQRGKLRVTWIRLATLLAGCLLALILLTVTGLLDRATDMENRKWMLPGYGRSFLFLLFALSIPAILVSTRRSFPNWARVLLAVGTGITAAFVAIFVVDSNVAALGGTPRYPSFDFGSFGDWLGFISFRLFVSATLLLGWAYSLISVGLPVTADLLAQRFAHLPTGEALPVSSTQDLPVSNTQGES